MSDTFDAAHIGSSSELITSVGRVIPVTTPMGLVLAWYSSSDAYPSAPYSRRCNSAMDPARDISSYDGDIPEDDNTFSLSNKNIFFTDARRYRSSNGSNRLNAPPSVVSYPGHTHVVASNGDESPRSPACRTARPVPALSA